MLLAANKIENKPKNGLESLKIVEIDGQTGKNRENYPKKRIDWQRGNKSCKEWRMLKAKLWMESDIVRKLKLLKI